MSILNVNKINPVGSGSTVTIAGIVSVTNSVTAPTFVGDINNSTLLLQTGGSERLRITSAGRIGIGTETPDSILAIEGTGSDNNTRITIKDGTGIAEVNGRYGNLILDSDRDNAVNGSVMTFNVDGSERFRIDPSGRLLIGTQSTSDNAFLVVKGNVTGSGQQGEMLLLNGASPIEQNYGLGQITFGGGTGDQISSKIQGFADHDWNTGGDGTDSPGRLVFFTTPDGSATPTEKLRISSEGYITKPLNPVFNAFGGPSNVATNTDIVFGQERFDVGGGYNTSTGEYTAPASGYYHFYAQVYRQTTENDAWWGFYYDSGSGYAQISESRLENDYGGDSGRGYSTLQSSIYWYMAAGQKMKCRVGSEGAIHCNTTLSYFCGNLIG